MSTDLTEIDASELRQQASLKEAQSFIEQAAATNLDEVVPGTEMVAFREFVPDTTNRLGYRVELEHKEINLFVPMFMLNQMLANQKKAQKLREKFKAEQEKAKEKEATYADVEEFFADSKPLNYSELTDKMLHDILLNSEPMLIWQAKEVLGVWRLTQGEEGMTLKRLLLGLDFEKLNGLFSRFFGAMLLQKKSKA